MPFFAVDLFKQRVRLIDFRFNREKIKRGEIEMRLRVIAKLEAERVRGVDGLSTYCVEKVAVEKHGGTSGAVGIVFIERSKNREYVFKRAFGCVVERERHQLSVRIDMRNIDVRNVPNVRIDCGRFRFCRLFRRRGVWYALGKFPLDFLGRGLRSGLVLLIARAQK